MRISSNKIDININHGEIIKKIGTRDNPNGTIAVLYAKFLLKLRLFFALQRFLRLVTGKIKQKAKQSVS